MKKNLFFILTFVLMIAVSAVSADDLSEIKQAGVLRFGAPLEYIPFVFEDEDTRAANGLDIALMEEICKKIGVKLEKLTFARDGIIDALNLGQVDVIGGGLSKTDERAKRIDFTRTYYNGEAQVISLASTPKPQSVNLESFRNKKIGVVKGSSFQEWVNKNLVEPNIIKANEVYTFVDSADGIKALERGDVDLIVIDQDVYDMRYRAAGKYQVFYSGFNTENYAFGLRKNSTLTEVINNYLVEMLKDGTAQSIANRFFSMDFTKKLISKPEIITAPTVTVVPSASTCVNGMSYVADVTVKDGTVYDPNSSFRKTWRIYNNGTCTWTTDYVLQFVSGDAMNGSYVRIPSPVQPGKSIDISADLRAPAKAGNYKGYWQMRTPQGTNFGQTIWVNIRVNKDAGSSDGQTRVIPVINYFYAANDQGHMGDGTMLYWSVSNAAGVTITCNGATIENSGILTGTAPINAPLQRVGTHEIKLTAHSVTDDVSASVYYTMYDHSSDSGQTRVIPEISYFYSNKDSGYVGEALDIYWGTNANGVTISVDGYDIVNSSATGQYQLQAPIHGVGSHRITLTAQTVTDSVSQTIYYQTLNNDSYGGGGSYDGGDGQTRVIPTIDYLYASPDSGYTGDGTVIYWSASNASGVTITVDGYEIANSSATGQYQLQAPVQGVGTHTITVTAQSVTDSASASCYFTMNSQEDSGYDYDSSDNNSYSYDYGTYDNNSYNNDDNNVYDDSLLEENYDFSLNEENW